MVGGEILSLDINKVKQCYEEFKKKQDYYLKIDKYYYGNTTYKSNSSDSRAFKR